MAQFTAIESTVATRATLLFIATLVIVIVFLPFLTGASVWSLRSIIPHPFLFHNINNKLRIVQAFRKNLAWANHCNFNTNTSTSATHFGLVPSSLVTGLGTHARDVPVACLSNITVTTVYSGVSVTVPIISLCNTCRNNEIWLSVPAFDELGEGDRDVVDVYFTMDLASSQYNDSLMLETWELPTNNISIYTLFDEIRAELSVSVKKNALRWNQACDPAAEEMRLQIMSGDYSHLFQDTPRLRNSFELRYKLMRANRVEGLFCNSYQNLICDGSSQCQCYLTDGATLLENCTQDIVTRPQPCLLDLTDMVSQRFGIDIPRPTNQCWLHHLCAMKRDGKFCNAMYRDRLDTLMAPNPFARAHTPLDLDMHLLRFAMMHPQDPSESSNCVCMDPSTLNPLARTSFKLFSELTTLTKLNTLELDSKCDYRAEELKLEKLSELRALDGPLKPSIFRVTSDIPASMRGELELRDQVVDALSGLLIRTDGRRFCKTYKHLMCSETSETCECYSNPAEQLELMRDGDKCVLKAGSICDPAFWSGRFESYVSPYEDDARRPSCEQGSPCLHAVTGQLCPRNDSNFVSISYKDKIFPYVDPKFELLVHQLEEEAGIKNAEYCRCGEPLKNFAQLEPLAVGTWGIWALIAAFIVLIFAASILGLWYGLKLRAAADFLRKLPESEQRVFLEGDRTLFAKYTEDGGMRAQFRPYNKKRCEIPRSCVKYGAMIGRGGFGNVLRGTITRGGSVTEVAIKKCNDDSDVDTIRAFVVELKILQYVGRHGNIVHFIGAITENSPAPELVLEYCVHGSLQQKLRENQSLFLDQIVDDELDFGFRRAKRAEDVLWMISTTNLLRWSVQIANGMEYLAEKKKVVHGDLFLKNVLVAADGTAKITDFGLSRRFAYGDKLTVICIQEGIFPLAHLLPPEVRTNGHKRVSSQMDVWTFGILLWELFSLGSEPNCVNSSAEELPRPDYATRAIIPSCKNAGHTNRQAVLILLP